MLAQLLAGLLDGCLGDAGGRGHVARGRLGAGALHHHVDDRGGDGLRVAPHVELVLQRLRRPLRLPHLRLAHPEPRAEAAHVVGGAHDAHLHGRPGLLPEVPPDDPLHPPDLLLVLAIAHHRGELLQRPRVALVAARDVEAGRVRGVAVPHPGAQLRLLHLLEQLLGPVSDGGHELEAVRHVGDGAERDGQRAVLARLGVDAHMRRGGGGLRLPRGRRDDGAERRVREEGVGAAADAVGVAVLAAAGVGERAPLGGLVDVPLLQDERALGADGVAGGVVHHHHRRAVALRAVTLLVAGDATHRRYRDRSSRA